MTKKTISSAAFKEAVYGLPRIEALVSALENIDRQTVSGNVDAFAEIQSFKSRLIPIFNNYKKIVDGGKELFENRNTELINKASNRLFEIPRDVDLLKSSFEHEVRADEYKTKALREQGLSTMEIAEVHKPITKSEREELASKIKSLKNEEKALLDFLSDGPAFDSELLKNTAVYPESTKII